MSRGEEPGVVPLRLVEKPTCRELKEVRGHRSTPIQRLRRFARAPRSRRVSSSLPLETICFAVRIRITLSNGFDLSHMPCALPVPAAMYLRELTTMVDSLSVCSLAWLRTSSPLLHCGVLARTATFRYCRVKARVVVCLAPWNASDTWFRSRLAVTDTDAYAGFFAQWSI